MDLKEKNYTLVFKEDFAEGLEKNKWEAVNEVVKARQKKVNTEIVPSHVITSADELHESKNLTYMVENVNVKNGELTVSAGKDDDGYTGAKAFCNGFVFRYGYLEAEVLLPEFQEGVWPKFITATTGDEEFKTSFDIISVFGEKGKNAPNMYIEWVDSIYETKHRVNCLYPKDSYDRFYPSDSNEEKIPSGYHKFGVDWDTDAITFYFDGEKYCTVDITDVPFMVFRNGNLMKLGVELSIGLPAIPAPTEDIKLPTEFKIKNIKLYQNDKGAFIKR